MQKNLILATAVYAFTAVHAQASNPFENSNFFADGFVDLSYLDTGSSSQEYLYANFDLGFLPGQSGGLGFTIGLDLLSDFDDTNEAIYWAGVYKTGNHTFSFGNPRSVVDVGYGPKPVFAYSRIGDLELNRVTNSFTRVFQYSDNITPLGLRWDGDFGATRVGASYHNVDRSNGNRVEFLSVMAEHELDSLSSFIDMMIYGGFEHVRSNSDTTIYRLGVEGTTDRLTAGFGVSLTEGADTYLGYAEYEAMDNLGVSFSLNHRDDGGASRTFYGIGAEYEFGNHFYGNASFIDRFSSGSDHILQVTVGARF